MSVTRRIIRKEAAADLIGLSTRQVDRLKDFPEKIQISARSVGYFEDELVAWLEARRVVRSTAA